MDNRIYKRKNYFIILEFEWHAVKNYAGVSVLANCLDWWIILTR
jgi:hypothetical protein